MHKEVNQYKQRQRAYYEKNREKICENRRLSYARQKEYNMKGKSVLQGEECEAVGCSQPNTSMGVVQAELVECFDAIVGGAAESCLGGLPAADKVAQQRLKRRLHYAENRERICKNKRMCYAEKKKKYASRMGVQDPGNQNPNRSRQIDDIPIEPHKFQLQPNCVYCGAKKFTYESKGFCCSEGDVSLSICSPPEELYALYTGGDQYARAFRQYIRTYNNKFAFTSLGVKYDKELAQRYKGISTFKVQGQVYHFINELLPSDNHPSFLQLYFYDTEHEVEHRRFQSFQMDEVIITKLMDALSINPYSKFFRSLISYQTLEDIRIFIRTDSSLDQRVFNSPSASQVAGIWIEDADSEQPGRRDIVVYTHNGIGQSVQYYFGCYDPLQYPLLFPFGEFGWHEGIKKKGRENHVLQEVPHDPVSSFQSVDSLLRHEQSASSARTGRRDNVSCRQYYCYKLQIRDSVQSVLLHSGRLLQQYAVDMYIKIESSRLDYIRHEQKKIRADLYQGIIDGISQGQRNGSDIGKPVILPSSFIGGPRDMRRRYLDAMALVRKFGKPDFFLTMTCNPAWPEIKRELRHGEEAQNRPDLLARIFRAKIEELKQDLFKENLFGKVAARVHVIEFQKRGLPHAHFLIILMPGSKILSPDCFDDYVSAELPDKLAHPHLYRMVLQHMIHGPCGLLNPKCVCMRNDTCKNHYPRDYCSVTTQGKNSYPIYKRRQTGEQVVVRGALVDNRWVVPYNPFLLAKYDCHMNVEICSTIKAVKYLYKYIYKGHDRVVFNINEDATADGIDEIRAFQSGRWVSPPEAMWRIYKFNLNEIHPPVKTLQLHLPNMQHVGFRETDALESITQSARTHSTMLTEYFATNKLDINARKVLYREFPEQYVWDGSTRTWNQRKKGESIGRIVSANPIEGERYYLRCLLNHVRGAISFADLRTVNDKICISFREAAEHLGLLESDNSIEECLQEASLFQMPSSLRRLFATVLVFCAPSNPVSLWNKFKDSMSEDYDHSRINNGGVAYSRVLQSINVFLESMGKSISDYSLPSIVAREDDNDHINIIGEELSIPISDDDLLTITRLNSEQRYTYDLIMKRITDEKAGAFFVDGPGGSGKTYLYRALLTKVRRTGSVALATATSGVAASTLPGGRTTNSRFKIPIDVDEYKSCNIPKQSSLAKLIRMSKLIIWDEVTMAKKQTIEILDQLLRDITGVHSLFGGKVIVFGGDFRQVLPVVPRSTKHETIAASFVASSIWSKVEKFRLVTNMRALLCPSYSDFLLRIGNGTEPHIYEDRVSIPEQILIPYNDKSDSKAELIEKVFPNLSNNGCITSFMTNRALLTTKNEFVEELNDLLIDQFPGTMEFYHSFDSVEDSVHQPYPEDLLNSLTPNGLPPHRLKLKVNCPIMLLRNIDPSSGLCNGTRLICKGFQRNVIHAEISVGHHKGKTVFLPRIPLQPSTADRLPIMFKRKQFPIRLCFAMTINKSQGQTLDFVGIYLPQPVFSHGQLYVALSRVRSPDAIKVLIKPSADVDSSDSITRNVVYTEILTLAGVLEPT